MLRNHFGALTALLIAGAVVLAGCSSSGDGGGGGGGGGDGGTTPPTVSGNYYYLPVHNSDGTQEFGVTLGTTQWIVVDWVTEDALFWGDVAHTEAGFIRLLPTGGTISDLPERLYAVELPSGFLFLVTSDDAVGPGRPGAYKDIQVGFDMNGAAPAVGTRFNFVRVGEDGFNQLADVAFGALTVSTGTQGLDFSGPGTSIAFAYGGDPLVSSLGHVFTGGNSVSTPAGDEGILTASGIGHLQLMANDADYILVPETAVAEADIVTNGKRYLGFGQVTGDPAVSSMYTMLFHGVGTGSSLVGQAVLDPEVEESYTLAEMGTLMFGVSTVTGRPEGMFDQATLTQGKVTNVEARILATTVNGKVVLALMAQCDNDGDGFVTTPQDWIFIVLVEQ